jgi:hypothetical protein
MPSWPTLRTSEGLVHVPADDAAWAATARPRTAASAVVAARLSDAEAKAVRLDCHDHRRRRGIWGWANDEPNEEPTEEPTTAGFTPRKSDFEIGIKILDKKCFGSVGCSVTYRSKPKYVGTQELN